MTKEKELRSFIIKDIPKELRMELRYLTEQTGISSKRKHDILVEMLSSFDIGNGTLVKLGGGTNRYCVRTEGYVLKFATDHHGMIDNKKEYRYSKYLYPYAALSYEVNESGTIQIAEYIRPIESFNELKVYIKEHKEMLEYIYYSLKMVMGDVGINEKNHGNLGIRVRTGQFCMLDYAYAYMTDSKRLICMKCENYAMLRPTDDYSNLCCSNPECRKITTFQELRGMIPLSEQINEIGDLSSISYKVTEPVTKQVLDPNISLYLNNKK